VFKAGDLVQISAEADIKYFRSKNALVMKNLGEDATDNSNGFYYMLRFDDGSTHVFMHREIVLLSKAGSEV
jgi:hypothetical protein